jgi:hypothetical protein
VTGAVGDSATVLPVIAPLVCQAITPRTTSTRA